MNKNIKEESINLGISIIDAFSGIPVFGTVNGFRKIYTEINEQIFREKLESFLKEYSNEEEIRNKFKISLGEDEDTFFKKIWIIIGNLDDNEKATILGKVFKAVLNEKIKIESFLQIAAAVQIIPMIYLTYFLSGRHKQEPQGLTDALARKQLVSAGIMYDVIETESQFGTSQAQVRYVPSHVGDALIQLAGISNT